MHFPLIRLFTLAAALVVPATATAQIPIPQPTPQNPADTIMGEPFRIPPPVPPLGTLLRSMLVPGWGQSILHRRATGAFFVVFEGISLTMLLKSVHQLDYLTSVETEEDSESVERVESKRQEIQDWAILLGFNHLIAGVEAFVSAQLWDFPDELVVQALPDGRIGVGLSITIP